MNAASARSRPAARPTGEPARSAARSHVGLMRSFNEDRVFDGPDAGLWAVADGMGGHRGGDQAAQLAIDELRRLAQAGGAPADDDVAAALARANAAIVERNRALGLDAGATIVVALLHGRVARIGWAGDSRAYRLPAAGGAERLTTDHSVVQEMIEAGVLTAAAAERHPQANVITRALGVGDAVTVDWLSVELCDGDRLLLCSDGLSRSLRDTDGEPGLDLDQLADAMLANALTRDGSDNISLVVVQPGA